MPRQLIPCPSLAAARRHYRHGGTAELKACPHGCYQLLRDTQAGSYTRRRDPDWVDVATERMMTKIAARGLAGIVERIDQARENKQSAETALAWAAGWYNDELAAAHVAGLTISDLARLTGLSGAGVTKAINRSVAGR
jgi:hypothetical protein